MSDVMNKVRQMLAEEFGLPDIQDDTPLFSSKLLDSMDVLKLIMLLEGGFSIKIPTFEVSLEMFDTVESISRLVQARR